MDDAVPALVRRDGPGNAAALAEESRAENSAGLRWEEGGVIHAAKAGENLTKTTLGRPGDTVSVKVSVTAPSSSLHSSF